MIPLDGIVTQHPACGTLGSPLAERMTKISYAGYRFPPEVIHQAIWLYLRFTPSLRDVEDLLAERGVAVSYDTVRRWVNHFGRHCQSKIYTACSRIRADRSSTVFTHELTTRSAGFDAENRLYLFALTMPSRLFWET